MKTVEKALDLICDLCGRSWCQAEPKCPDNHLKGGDGWHEFKVKEVWTDLPMEKVLVCWYCAKYYDNRRCEASEDGQHAFLLVDVLTDAAEAKLFGG